MRPGMRYGTLLNERGCSPWPYRRQLLPERRRPRGCGQGFDKHSDTKGGQIMQSDEIFFFAKNMRYYAMFCESHYLPPPTNPYTPHADTPTNPSWSSGVLKIWIQKSGPRLVWMGGDQAGTRQAGNTDSIFWGGVARSWKRNPTFFHIFLARRNVGSRISKALGAGAVGLNSQRGEEVLGLVGRQGPGDPHGGLGGGGWEHSYPLHLAA